jgi:delta24-sterol reductase
VLPANTLISFLEFIDDDLKMYPIGMCPLKPELRSPLQCNGIDTDMVYNVGVYGLRVDSYEEFVAMNKRIEDVTHRLGGKKWFYAHSYYSKQEFWQIYDKKWYDKLRKKYHATTLPDIYDRTRVKERYPVNVRRGTLKTIF